MSNLNKNAEDLKSSLNELAGIGRLEVIVINSEKVLVSARCQPEADLDVAKLIKDFELANKGVKVTFEHK